MLKLEIKPSLLKKLNKILKKDKKSYLNILNKINEIINSDEKTILHYKNLKKPLQKYKRVHLNSHFVLVFEFDIHFSKIIFINYSPHDDIYL